MKRFAALAVIPLFAGFLCAQDQSSQTTTTTTTTARNWDGTLVDAGCRTTHTVRRESNTNPDQSVTTREQRSEKVECPVTTTTTTFGLLTPDGNYVRFDDASNTRIRQSMREHQDWDRDISGHRPIRVHVVGTENGDTLVIESIR